MAWRLTNSLVQLRDQINAAYPNRSRASDGTIGDAAHAASASDHNPNAAGVVCAMDITHSPAQGLDAHALADHLLANRNPNLKYLISNKRIAGDWTGWRWTPYYGSNPHSQHIHVSVGRGSDGRSTGPYDGQEGWNVNYKGGSMATDKLTREDVIEIHRAYFFGDPGPGYGWEHVGKPLEVIVRDWKNSSYRQNAVNRYWAFDTNQKTIADLNARVAEMNRNIEKLQGDDGADKQTIATLQKASADAKKIADELQKQNDALLLEKEAAVKTGNAFTRWIGELINSIAGAK